MERKNPLRAAFGEEGDVSESMKEMFGEAYLDYVDTGDMTTTEKELKERFSDNEVFQVNGSIERAVELAPEITCKQSQQAMLMHIDEHILESSPQNFTWDHAWAILKHMEEKGCRELLCKKLYKIYVLSQKINAGRMRKIYGRKIEEIRKEVLGR